CMILVTGGLGFIGAHTVRALAALGQRCLAVTRRPVRGPAPFADLGGMATVVQADPADLPSLRRGGGGGRVRGGGPPAPPGPGPPGGGGAVVRTRGGAVGSRGGAAPPRGAPRGAHTRCLGG